MRAKFLIWLSFVILSFQAYNAKAQCPTNGATIITPTSPSCNGNSDGSILYEFTDGTGPFNTADWVYTLYTLVPLQIVTPPFGSAVVSFPSANEVLLSGLSANNYVLTVDHIPSGCTVQITPLGGTPLVEPAVLDFIGTTTSSDCIGNSGAINVQANGGTAPYTINYVSGPTVFPPANIATDGGTVNISGLLSGSYDVEIVDTNSCTLINTFNVESPPVDQSINESPSTTLCDGDLQPVTLTTSENGAFYEIFVGGVSTGISNTAIGNPNFLIGTVAGLPVGASVITVEATLNGCTITLTDNINVTVNAYPNADAPADVTACDGYVLPALTVGNYFTTTGGVGPIAVGTNITSTQTIFVYAETGTTPNCTDENSFLITINTTPVADAPADVTACDGYVLPALTVGNYFSTTGGVGPIAVGTNITSTQTIFVYAETGTTPNCTDENSFLITINTTPTADAPADVIACDGYVLPALTVGNYFSTTGGVGPIAVGTNITSTQTIFVYAETGTTPNCTDENSFLVTINNSPLDQSINESPSTTLCDGDLQPVTLTTSENGAFYEIFVGGVSTGISNTAIGNPNFLIGTVAGLPVGASVITVEATLNGCTITLTDNINVTVNAYPNADAPADVTACDGYVLPALTVGNYFTTTGGVGPIAVGTNITSTQTIFVYAETGTTPNCTDENSFLITINTTPVADAPADVTACDGYVLPALTVGNYFSTTGGVGPIAVGTNITSTQTIFVYAETGTTPNCTDENSFLITINTTPTADAPADVIACDGYVLPALTVGNYFTTTGGVGPIAVGTNITSTQTIFVYAETGTTPNCTDENSFLITINTTPVADAPADVIACDGYVLPALTVGNYFTTTGGVGPIAVGTNITSTQTIFVYAETGTTPNCTDENSFLITINTTPTADAPADVVACDSYVLPALTVGNYFSTTGGVGPIAVGTSITSTQTIFVYAETGTTPNCIDENSFLITINTTPTADAPADVVACDSYVLPALTVGNYFSTTGGVGPIAVGTSITSTQTIFVYAETGTTPNCIDENSFLITINTTPTADAPADVVACDSYVLPALTVGNYFSTTGGVGPIAVGTSITSTQTIFVYAETGTTPNCTDENSFLITINTTPTADAPADVVACDSYVLPALTVGNYFSTTGGVGPIVVGTSITSTQTIFVYAETGTTPNCVDENSFIITINISSIAPTSATADILTYCNDAAPVNIILSHAGGSLGTGATAEWYDDAGFTSSVGSGNNLSIPAPSISTTYFVRFESACGNTTAQSVAVNVDIASILPTAANVDVATYCDDASPATITLSYTDGTLGTGATAEWYSDATFTTGVATGNNQTIAAPAATTTYYVRFEGSCNITTDQNVTVTVDNASIAPTSTTADILTYCDDAAPVNIILSHAGGSLGTGATAEWYDDAGFTSSVGSGNNLSIPAPSISTTYFVRFESACGNTTAQSVAVNVDIASILPTAANVDVATYCDDASPATITLSYTDGTLGTGATAEWYSDATFTTGVATGNNQTIAAPAATTTYYVRFEGSCNITTDQNVTVTVDNASIPPISAAVDIATYCEDAVPANILLSYAGGTLGTGATAEWYSDAGFTTSVGSGNNLSIGAPAISTTYFVRFEGGCNITADQSVGVDVVSLPDATITGPANVCANTTESYSAAAGAVSYTWSIVGGDGVISSGVGTENITVDWGMTGGDLILDVVGLAPTSCTNNSLVGVTVFNTIAPLAPLSLDDCQNNTIPTLVALPITGATVNWYVGSSATGTLVHTGDSYTPAVTELDMTTPGATIFTYTQSIACLTSTDSDFTVNIISQPSAGTDNAISVCLSDPAFDLFPQLGGTPDSGGSWADDDLSGALVGSSFDPGAAGSGTYNFTYQVDGSGPCTGQSVTAIVTVDVATTTAAPIPDQELYTGCAYSVPPTLNTPGNNIRWYGDMSLMNLVGTGNSFTPTGGVDIDSTMIGSTIYYVTQDDGCGESPAAEVEVNLEGLTAEIGEVVNSYPEQNIGAIEVINFDSDDPPFQVSLEDAAGNLIYDWISLEEDRLGDFSYLFTLLPADDYIVWVRDSKGCTFPILQSIIFETKLFIPNVFTPNGDNYNDYFKILNKSGAAQVRINNRWGVKVFESDDYQNDWQAENLPEGVYFYTVKMDGAVYNGNVEVWRHGGPTGSN